MLTVTTSCENLVSPFLIILNIKLQACFEIRDTDHNISLKSIYALSSGRQISTFCNQTQDPEKVLKEVHEQMDLLVKQEIPSMIMYQRIALDLAAGPLNAGRVLVIQFFSETVKEHLVKKLCGMSQSEYRNQSWFLWLTTYFSRQAVTYRRLIREIDHIEGLCLLFAHLRLQCGSTGSEEKEKM